MPEDATVVPSIWAMQRKRDLTTNAITKHKAGLNLHGRKQEFGVNCYETYATEITWFAMKLMIVFALVFSWCLRQVDFVLAYTQPPIEMDMYMELPDRIEPKGGSKAIHVLILSNLYGQKQAGQVVELFLSIYDNFFPYLHSFWLFLAC